MRKFMDQPAITPSSHPNLGSPRRRSCNRSSVTSGVIDRKYVCDEPGCDKSFRHHHHLLRHKTQKHGRVPTKNRVVYWPQIPGVDGMTGVDASLAFPFPLTGPPPPPGGAAVGELAGGWRLEDPEPPSHTDQEHSQTARDNTQDINTYNAD